jgi:acetyl/propionyl-CoA carboxylase alpha subunit
MIYHVTVGTNTYVVDLSGDGVSVDGRARDVDFARLGSGPIRSLIIDGTSHRLVARRGGAETWDIYLRGRRIRAGAVDERTLAIREMTGAEAGPTGPRPIVAPMPGMVVRIEVAEGDTVAAGQGVVIVEAMKMENELKAGAEARVSRVLVEEGQPVEKGQLLIDFEPIDT